MEAAADPDARQTPAREIGRFVRHHAPGEPIFNEGERGDSLFVIVKGSVNIEATATLGTKHLAALSEGDTFGEIALVDTDVRTATARAGAQGADVVEINRARFVYLVSQQPAFALAVMRGLCRRIKQLDQLLREARP